MWITAGGDLQREAADLEGHLVRKGLVPLYAGAFVGNTCIMTLSLLRLSLLLRLFRGSHRERHTKPRFSREATRRGGGVAATF